jgi:hypothetical protein
MDRLIMLPILLLSPVDRLWADLKNDIYSILYVSFLLLLCSGQNSSGSDQYTSHLYIESTLRVIPCSHPNSSNVQQIRLSTHPPSMN